MKDAFADANLKTEKMFITWGYNQMFHGEMSREPLDTISSTYPIFVWHRSAHEAYFNTPMLKYLEDKGLTEASVKGNPHIDWRKGYFFEDGLFKVAVPVLADYLLAPERVDKGYAKTRDYLNFNGITTVADMNTGGSVGTWRSEP